MYDCQQLQLMYQVHQVKNDNDYTQIKSRIKEEKKWWYGTGVNMSKNCKTIDLRGAQVNEDDNGDDDDDDDDDDDVFNFIMCKHLVKPETKKRYSLLCQTYSDANLFIDLCIY